jgi:hypothetical protein
MANRLLVLLIMNLTLSSLSRAEMKSLDDESLSEVSGQSGITADLATKFSIGELAYFDDGNGIALQGVKMSSAADPAQLAEYRLELDILNNGDLSLSFSSQNVARFEIEEIRFVDNAGQTPAANDPSIGGIFIDYEIEGTLLSYNQGNGPLGVNNVSGGLYDIDFVIQNGRFGYRTNGNEFLLDGMELDVNSLGTVFGVTPGGELNLSMPNLLAELKVDAIRYSNNPNNHGVTNDVDTGSPLDSFGSLWVNMDVNSDLLIRAGGADGAQGMTINSTTLINRMDVAWGDDTDWASSGYWVGALGISGSTDLVNLTVDVLDDEDSGASDYGKGLALAFERLAIDLHVQDFVLGETKANIDSYISGASSSIKSVGSFDIGLTFEDAIYNGVSRTNKVLVQAGGNVNAGYQGLRLDTQLSLASPNNESNFVYTDDGNSLMLSKLEGFVDGDITVDITSAGDLNGETFYDGLRVGFEDVAFGYQIEGVRVAKSTGDKEDLKSAELRSAQTIEGLSALSGLFGAPSLEGDLNGHITLGAGGREGVEGVTVNSDIAVTDGVMATYLEADGTGNGIWLSGLNYDVHLRDMMLDVTNEGLKIYETESWSKLDVTDFRIGDKVAGASFGGLVLESYEQGSETLISAGGAGAVCIGGVGGDATSCESDNGRWEDRGDQGITIFSKRHLKTAVESENKRNRFTWHTNRTKDGAGVPDKSTGLRLIFDNYTTNDGNGLTDDFGIQSTYNMDIAHAPVIKKSTGLDSNNVYGEAGWEKVMLADGSYEYRDPATMTDADRANRPVGIAVRTNTQFKELDFDRVNLGHHTGGESTLLYGLKLQNFNVTTDITATPLD